MSDKFLNLAAVKKGFKGKVIDVCEKNSELARTMLELGFHENAELEILHKGAFGKDPIAIRINDSIFALRSCEAKLVSVLARE